MATAEPRGEIAALFETPVLWAELPGTGELNRQLTEALLGEERAGASVSRSNVGGWHSAPDLAQRPGGCFQAITDQVAEHVLDFSRQLAGQPLDGYRLDVQGWAMIMRAGDYTVLHDHGDAHWSAVYWVDAGDPAPAPSGRLVLVDPRRGGRPIPGVDIPANTVIEPRTASLVVFPGWLQHYVHVYRGDRPRISLSWNLVLVPRSGE